MTDMKISIPFIFVRNEIRYKHESFIRKGIKNKITGSCYKNNNFRKNITKYFSKASFSFIYTIVLKKNQFHVKITDYFS